MNEKTAMTLAGIEPVTQTLTEMSTRSIYWG